MGCKGMAEKSLEELLLETEQKILNKDFYKRFILTYEDEDYEFYVKPISQKSFMKLYTQYGQKNIMELNEKLLHECLVHADGTSYNEKLIGILLDQMPAGFSADVAKCVYEVSGLETNMASSEELERFLKETLEL